MTIGSGRLITACDHRAKVYGMGKEEVMRRVREWASEKFHISPSVEFLRRYTTPELYGLMRSVARGEWHSILTQWNIERAGSEVRSSRPIPGTAETEQLKLF